MKRILICNTAFNETILLPNTVYLSMGSLRRLSNISASSSIPPTWYTGLPVKHISVFWYLVKKKTCLGFTCTVAYTEKVTFYKVPEKYGHVYLVGLYHKNKSRQPDRDMDMDLLIGNKKL